MSHPTSVTHHNISTINEAAREGVWFVCFLFVAKKQSVIKEKNPELLEKVTVIKIHN